MERQLRRALLVSLCSWIALAPIHASSGRSEPWGTLDKKPLMISPPVEYVPQASGPIAEAVWHFPGLTRESLGALLRDAGLAPDVVSHLQEIAVPEAPELKTPGLVVKPGSAIVRGLTPDVRAKLYLWLARSPLNFDQQSAYYVKGNSIDQWLRGDPVSARARKAVEPLIYRIGDFMYLADIELAREEIGSGPEFQALVRRLLRQEAILVSVRVDRPDQLDTLAEYWGRGGRKTDIQPLLESIGDAGPTQSINISELLPELPRRLLYRYQKVSLEDLGKPQLANCFWTALNFFASEPDDRYLDPEVAMNTLRRDYFLVHDGMQLGDVVVLSSHAMNVFHVATYLADDLVFTKNGAFSLAPWTILQLDDLKGPYVGHTNDWMVTYYRRKDR